MEQSDARDLRSAYAPIIQAKRVKFGVGAGDPVGISIVGAQQAKPQDDSAATRFAVSYMNPFDLAGGCFVAGAIVELCGARRRVRRDLSGGLKRPAVVQVYGDAGAKTADFLNSATCTAFRETFEGMIVELPVDDVVDSILEEAPHSRPT